MLLDIGLFVGDGILVLERYSRLLMLSATFVVVLTGCDLIVIERAVCWFNVLVFLTKLVDNKQLVDVLAVVMAELDGVGDDEGVLVLSRVAWVIAAEGWLV